MSLLDRLRTNIEDITTFGPQFLLRHLPRVTGAGMAPVHIPGVGIIYLRAGESDVAGVRQIFGSREYDIGAPVQAAGLRINARYRAILEAGRKPVIVDAGANIGAAALWFGKKYPDAAVVAVEPDPGNVRVLKCNLTGRHDMIVLAAAIGARSGFVEVKKEKDSLSWVSRTTRAESGVPVVTMTDAVAKVANGVPFIVKIDIEGFESDLFSTNVGWLDDVYPQLFVGAGDWRCERMTSAGLTAVDALGHWRRVWRLELGARAALAASLMDRRRRLRWRARSRLERSDRLRAAPS